MNKLITLIGALMVGCTTHTSKVENFDLKTADFTPPVEQVGCGWTIVDESLETKFLMLDLGKTTRQYNKSLYYCCPGKSNPEPICYQSQWVSK